MEIFLDCPTCDGRLVFRAARPSARGRSIGLPGRCTGCGAAFHLLGGQLRHVEPEPRRHPV